MTLVQAALGTETADLLLRDVRLANVATGEIYPAEITVHEGKIVAVEPPDSAPSRRARRVIEGGGRLAVPGLIDSHMHIESSLVTPAPFAAAALQRGTTTVAEDPHEIANVAGLEGVGHFLAASRQVPLDIRFLASPCVPAAAGLEHCRGELGPAEIAEMLRWNGVIGIAEVMDARAAIQEEPRMSAILEAGRQAGTIIDGHNPMLQGRELMAYISAGVDSDHTIASPERILAKLRLGVTIQLQEAYMTGEVIGAIRSLPQPPASLCLVTDDVAPDYLEATGHLDQVLRRAVSLGLPPMQALQAATINPARRLRLYDRGLLAPGRRADIVLVDGLERFDVSTTISEGKVRFDEGGTGWEAPARQSELDALRESLDLDPLAPEDFLPDLDGHEDQPRVRVIRADRRGTLTEPVTRQVPVANGEPQLADQDDLALIAVFARGGRSHFTGFVEGLGLRHGAYATSHSHDSHNLTVVGRDRTSMATVANAVIAAGGGIAVAEGEAVRTILPLPIAGVVSDAPLAEVAAGMRDLRTALAALGLQHPRLLMRLSTFTLPVSSGLRITDRGYVLAEQRTLVPLLAP